MLYCVIVWLFLGFACSSIGIACLDGLKATDFERAGDRAIAGTWLGVIVLAVCLLAASLVLPLSSFVGLTIALGLTAVAWWRSPFTRQELLRLPSYFNWDLALGSSLLASGVLFLIIRQVGWSESAFYHYSAMRWLSEFGAVRGVVLILKNLGITSSWFAFASPWGNINLNFRLATVSNGFICFLVLLQGLMAFSRFWRGKVRLSDGFIVGFCLFLVVLTGISAQLRQIINSPSPDFPIFLLSGIIGWAMLVHFEQFTSENPQKKTIAIVPFLLAAGAVTIKLSALPLFGIAALFYAIENRFRWRQLLVGGVLSVFLFLPMLSVGIKTSGCPLYPTTFLCLDVPWAQSLEETRKFVEETSNVETWYNRKFPQKQVQKKQAQQKKTRLELFLKWFKSDFLNRIMAFFSAIAFLGGGYSLYAFKTRNNQGILWIVGLAWCGTIFVLLKGPLLRFGLGYLALVPALLFALIGQPSLTRCLPSFKVSVLIFQKLTKKSSILRGVAFFFLGFILFSVMLSKNWQARLILPPNLLPSSLVQKQNNDVTYFVPLRKTSCWANIPCTLKLYHDIKLQDPKKGIGGGFIRTDL
jgi:hypothetical protein